MKYFMEITTEQLLSIGAGRLFCKMEDLYVIYNFLTGDKLYTHQLPRAFRVCQPHIEKQFPWVKTLNLDGCDTDNWQDCLNAIKAEHPGPYILSALPGGVWQGKTVLTVNPSTGAAT